jgi:ribonuclease Z
MAGLIHTFLTPQVIPLIFCELRAVYDGPVVQTQDLTVFNVTKEAVVVRQARVADQLPPIAGEQRVEYTPVQPEPPEWWAEALIPLDDVEAQPERVLVGKESDR